jgi:hypothetical protein
VKPEALVTVAGYRNRSLTTDEWYVRVYIDRHICIICMIYLVVTQYAYCIKTAWVQCIDRLSINNGALEAWMRKSTMFHILQPIRSP